MEQKEYSDDLILIAKVYSCLSPDQHRRLVLDFLNDYFDGGAFSMPTEEVDLIQLHRLYSRVSCLADRFFADVTHRVKNWKELYMAKLKTSNGEATPATAERSDSAKGDYKSQHSPLSTTERARLERAILRFEIYYRVFPINPDSDDLSTYTAGEQAELFISRLSTWEVEEVTSIHHYYSSVVANITFQLGEELEQAVCSAPGMMHIDPRPKSPPSGLRSLLALELRDMALWSEVDNEAVPYYISYITSLGLYFLHELVHASNARQAELISQTTSVSRQFLPEALNENIRPVIGTKKPENIASNDIEFANFGYWTFKRSSDSTYIHVYRPTSIHFPLREFGYMFWDSDRFAVSDWMEVFKEASELRYIHIANRLVWPGQPTVEERLQGIYLLHAEMQKIQQKFGSKMELWGDPYDFEFLKD
ncbi:hypothetical protein B0I35DRAFT_414070 [Stachybotrys elegans]|uniref:Uncharacterized protein n=1 Tax=Stachybotrys elegans TaxID=80388 RepID=A0A8K0SGI8_9HYPO|nr:hypothetical protein B0I35DRAFT_414070 [Stachybotrys elegans]